MYGFFAENGSTVGTRCVKADRDKAERLSDTPATLHFRNIDPPPSGDLASRTKSQWGNGSYTWPICTSGPVMSTWARMHRPAPAKPTRSSIASPIGCSVRTKRKSAPS